MIILLCSKTARQGKDSVAEMFIKNANFKRVAFADKLKEVCSLLGYKEELKVSNPEHRQLLIDVGMMARKFNPLIWVQLALDKINTFLNLGIGVVVSDLRYFNEAKYLKETYKNVYVIDIQSTKFGDMSIVNSESQIEYNDIKKDFIIINDGTLEDLEKQVIEIIDKLGLR